jgi:SAM-dependent methyltransferase
MASFKDHFSSHAAGYAAHRPTYPAALVDFLADFAPATRVAWDCGCGTGQLSVLLARRFDRVIATDASASQIANAEPHERVTYCAAPAERSGLGDSSVDLITVAQAAHWFDLDSFYDEVRRVAASNAAVALVSYGVVHVDDGEVDRVVQRFYYAVIGQYWPPERRHVEAGYRTLAFPFPEQAAPPMAIEVSWRAPDFIGYVDTWSAVREAEKRVGRTPFATFARDLAAVWGDPELRRTIRFPLALRVGRVSSQSERSSAL